ncbi:DUF6002 family protein [Streptomyces sp. NPDC057617]|uniref:DUF6002 family protein n=1 Tax=Streptomyces sp. NPDC057617 TaxID=3346184 RepID=UPI00368FDA52
MTPPLPAAGTETAAGNLILDHYDRLPTVVAACVADPAARPDAEGFRPAFAFPEPDAATRSFFAAATARWQPLGEYGGHPLTLLDLTGNPATGTTKTFASLLIVARAVEHIRRTGTPVMLFTPTSGNKGTALRDAVLRALEAGLADPRELRITTLAPLSSRSKMRRSRLSTDSELQALNPLLLLDAARPEEVKTLARAFADAYAQAWARETGGRLWFSLELENYLVADAARAFFEHRSDPCDGGPRRLHAHAVSSAFGLLGYHAGRTVLEESGESAPHSRPASFLVQHLHTPDMVLNWKFGSFDRANLPRYTEDPATGLRVQHDDPVFPHAVHRLDEVLDPTFYTHRPATSPAMNDLIARFGGGGIVVSLQECLQRYPLIAGQLADTGARLPDDPRTLTEWSLVMAMTGVLNGIDRGLVDEGPIVVHGTGSYADTDYEAVGEADFHVVRSVEDVAAAVWKR